MITTLTSDNLVAPTKPATLAKQSGAVLCSIELLDVRRISQTSFLDGRLVVWFSCGAASAVALKLVAHQKPLAVYCNTAKDEHADNVRFRRDVEAWTGIQVQVISGDFESVDDVFEARKYMSGVSGAPCTAEMKKVPRHRFAYPEDTHIFGYTADETMPRCKNPRKDRVRSFLNQNPELILAWPLVQADIVKQDCLDILTDAGIVLPMMYRLGFEHNNCIGCVKSKSARYWNKIRKYFPDVFAKRCEQSRRLGVRLVEYKSVRIFLDELPEDADEDLQEDLSCGPHCGEARTSNS